MSEAMETDSLQEIAVLMCGPSRQPPAQHLFVLQTCACLYGASSMISAGTVSHSGAWVLGHICASCAAHCCRLHLWLRIMVAHSKLVYFQYPTSMRCLPAINTASGCSQCSYIIQLFYQACVGFHARMQILACRDALRTDREALRQLQRIATALGESRTREELIPYVSEAQEDDDEYILVLAEELGHLLPHVGGSSHAEVLLAPLESLAASDETAVRDAVVGSMRKIIAGMDAADVESKFLPLLTRLATGCYPTRVAACDLYASVHPLVARQEQVRLRSEFETLTSDQHPVVRRSAAANLAALADAAGQEHIEFFLKLFVKTSQDCAHSP